MKSRILKAILVVLLSVVLVVLVTGATVIGLALAKPAVAWSPLSPDDTSAILSLRMSSQGVSISAGAAAGLLGGLLNGAGIPGFAVSSAGGAIAGNQARLAIAGTFKLPGGTAVLAGRTVPLSLAVRVLVEPGEKPVVHLRGISIGRLPVPGFLLDRVLSASLAQVTLPDFIAANGRAFTLDLSRIRIGGFALRSCRLEGERIVVELKLPRRAAEAAVAYLGRTLVKNRASIEEDGAQDSPSAPLMKDVAALAPLVSSAGRQVAVTEFIEKEPTVRYAEGGAELVLAIGDTLFASGTVRTKAGETVELRLADQSLVHVSEKTLLTLSSIAPGGKAPSVLDLAAGVVRVKVAKLADRGDYRVRTSTVTAGVRGTDFVVRVLPDGATVIAVVEGQVEVSGKAGTVSVTAGEETASAPDGGVQPAAPLSPESRRLLDAAGFVTPATVLNESFTPDALGVMWTVVRQALAQWNALPGDERARLQRRYEGAFNLEELASELGIPASDLARFGGS